MSKQISEPIKAHQSQSDDPASITAFIWRKRLYKVQEILNWWREPLDWWLEPSGYLSGIVVRFFVLVNASNSSTGTFELYKIGESWFISKVVD